MKLKVFHKDYSIVDLYETVAKEMGYINPKVLQFDCRKINVAKNIQDGFYSCYEKLANENEPNATKTEIRTEITMILAIVGPKVDENLADDEVEVFDGFIC